MNIITTSIAISMIGILTIGAISTNLVFGQSDPRQGYGGGSGVGGGSGGSDGIGYSGGSDRGAVSANAGTPGIAPGCPNPSGDNQCGEVPRQREIGQVYGSNQGWSENAQDPNDGLAVQCYGDNTAGVATQNTPNPNPSSGSC